MNKKAWLFICADMGDDGEPIPGTEKVLAGTENPTLGSKVFKMFKSAQSRNTLVHADNAGQTNTDASVIGSRLLDDMVDPTPTPVSTEQAIPQEVSEEEKQAEQVAEKLLTYLA